MLLQICFVIDDILRCLQAIVTERGPVSANSDAVLSARRSIRLLGIEVENLKKQLLQQRLFVKPNDIDNKVLRIEPRYVYIEFYLASLLRPRQVELLDSFRQNIEVNDHRSYNNYIKVLVFSSTVALYIG